MAKKKETKLYRSSKQNIFGGVCGGIADYTGVDVSIVRIIWIIATLLLVAGAFVFGDFVLPLGVLVYLIAWAIIPKNPKHTWKNKI